MNTDESHRVSATCQLTTSQHLLTAGGANLTKGLKIKKKASVEEQQKRKPGQRQRDRRRERVSFWQKDSEVHRKCFFFPLFPTSRGSSERLLRPLGSRKYNYDANTYKKLAAAQPGGRDWEWKSQHMSHQTVMTKN